MGLRAQRGLVLGAIACGLVFGPAAGASSPGRAHPSAVGSTVGTVLGDTTVTGNGHCFRQQAIAYSSAPYVSGQLFPWVEVATLCDTVSDVAVASIRTAVELRKAKSNGTEPGCVFGNGRLPAEATVTGAASGDGHGGSATYFEYGDGTTPPPDALGTSIGVPPEPLFDCAGTWSVVATSSVLETGSATWLAVGTSTTTFTVARHPQFALPEPPAVQLGATTTKKHGHCGQASAELYSNGDPVVGDLFQTLVYVTDCDRKHAPPLQRFQMEANFVPPAGCQAPGWMHPHQNASGGGSGRGLSIVFYLYGGFIGTAPPDLPPDRAPGFGGGGLPATVVVNCPGTWVVDLRYNAAEPGGDWFTVNHSKFPFTVLPQP